jgi:hypothetical protein
MDLLRFLKTKLNPLRGSNSLVHLPPVYTGGYSNSSLSDLKVKNPEKGLI